MKVANAATSNTSQRRRITPPISLERPEHKALEKGEYQTYKLRNTPADADSPTYELAVPYFSTGTCEEWLRFRKNLTKVLTGQNVTTGPASYAIARRLMEGDALATFDNKANELGAETVAHFTGCLDAVARQVFPLRAVQLQKRYMRRFLRKPATMKTREYSARIVEMNNYLPKFPPLTEGGPAPTKLPDDEIIDLLEFGVPGSWQKSMVVQDFDPMAHTVREVVAFCERMERVETEEGKAPGNQQPKEAKDGKNKQSKKRGKKRSSAEAQEGTDKYCMLHGNGNHTSEECRTLQGQAKRMKATYEAQHPSKKKAYKEKQEIHNMVMDAVGEAISKTFGDKKRKKSSGGSQKTTDELQNFEVLW
jgi:cell pole-organizing protein PopZ